MKKSLCVLGVLCVVAVLTSILVYCLVFDVFTGSRKSRKASVCFFTNWSQYRKGNASLHATAIDVNLCTHITFAHLMVDLHSHQLVNRQKNDAKQLSELVALKTRKPSLKIIISVGK